MFKRSPSSITYRNIESRLTKVSYVQKDNLLYASGESSKYKIE